MHNSGKVAQRCYIEQCFEGISVAFLGAREKLIRCCGSRPFFGRGRVKGARRFVRWRERSVREGSQRRVEGLVRLADKDSAD